jgi:hypothetical protein
MPEAVVGQAAVNSGGTSALRAAGIAGIAGETNAPGPSPAPQAAHAHDRLAAAIATRTQRGRDTRFQRAMFVSCSETGIGMYGFFEAAFHD